MNDNTDLRFNSETYRKIVYKRGLLYTKYVNRNVAWIFTRLLIRFSPNQISVSAFALLVVGLFWFVSRDQYGVATALILYSCLFFNYVLDSTDGQIARFKRCGSLRGEWLDHSLDALRMSLIHGVFIYYTYVTGAASLILVVCFLNIVFQPALFASNLLRDKLLERAGREVLSDATGMVGLVQQGIAQPADHGIFILISLLTAWPEYFYVAYAAYGLYWAVLYVITIVVTFRLNA